MKTMKEQISMKTTQTKTICYNHFISLSFVESQNLEEWYSIV